MTKTQFARALGRVSKLTIEARCSLLKAGRSILSTKKKTGAAEEKTAFFIWLRDPPCQTAIREV